MKSAICIICLRPHSDLVEFYSRFTNYTIIFMIDDSSFDCTDLHLKYPTVHFIQISNETCDKAGYKHSSYMPGSSLVFKEIIAWDKAIYYFSKISMDFDFVWFFEDDVFIHGEHTLQNIDIKYPLSDILCRDKTRQSLPGEWGWFWSAITIHFDPPYFQSMISAIRMSATLLRCIRTYIDEHKKMCFIEAMFPSIAHRYNLLYDTPAEFQGIYWRHDWNPSEINETGLFHPMKDIVEQNKYR